MHVEVGARPHLLPSGLGARQRDPVMDLPLDLPCPSPRKPRPLRSQRHVRQRQHLLLPSLSKQLEPLKQHRLIQVQLHYLQQQQFLSSHPRAARHSPWCRTMPIRALLAHPARVQQHSLRGNREKRETGRMRVCVDVESMWTINIRRWVYSCSCSHSFSFTLSFSVVLCLQTTEGGLSLSPCLTTCLSCCLALSLSCCLALSLARSLALCQVVSIKDRQ